MNVHSLDQFRLGVKAFAIDHSQPAFTLAHIKPFPGLFGGIVLNVTWNEMQPAPCGPIGAHGIDTALDEVDHYSQLHPEVPLGVKLRIIGSNQAPS